MITFAKASAKLGKSAGKYEDMQGSPHRADRNTANRMLGRIEQVMNSLQQEQEFISKPPGNSPQMGNGGWLGMGEKTTIKQGFQAQVQTPDTQPAEPEVDVPEVRDKSWARNNSDMLGNIGTSLLDAGIRQASIGSMSGPAAPVYSPYANMNEHVDNSAALNSIDRSTILRNKALDQGLSDNNVIQAHKGKAFADSINAKNSVFAETNKERTNLRRTKLMADNRTNLYNTSIANNHNSDSVDFGNNRSAATANNATNALTNYRLGQNEIFQNDLDGARMGFASKEFEESGVWERMMKDPAMASRMREMFPKMFE